MNPAPASLPMLLALGRRTNFLDQPIPVFAGVPAKVKTDRRKKAKASRAARSSTR